jgi:hypothetical protein
MRVGNRYQREGAACNGELTGVDTLISLAIRASGGMMVTADLQHSGNGSVWLSGHINKSENWGWVKMLIDAGSLLKRASRAARVPSGAAQSIFEIPATPTSPRSTHLSGRTP